jgi:tetratricopeptide (TPR) repeat protein
MKKVLVFILSFYSVAVFSFTEGKFGLDSIQCLNNISVFTQFVKQKNYVDAYTPWKWAYTNCPKGSKSIYIDGAKIFKNKIKENKSNSELKSAYIDTLLMIYDDRLSNFGQEGYVKGLKGSDLMKYRSSQVDLAYDLLKSSINLQGKKSKASVLYYYFKAVVVKANKGDYDKSIVLEAYALVTDYVDYNIVNAKSKKSYIQSLEKIEKAFVPFASCDDLISLFDFKYSQNPDEISLLRRIVKVLDSKDCTDAEVYFNATSKLHQLEPTAFSSFNMGNLSLKKGDANSALDFFSQAISMTDSDIDKSKYLLGLAQANSKLGKNSTARDLAYQAYELNSESGKAFFLIGDFYIRSATKCGTNAFEIGMVYSAAIDKFIKAKNIDPTLKEVCNKKIAVYSEYFPTTDDAFFNGAKDGDNFTVGCWINETTKVRIK